MTDFIDGLERDLVAAAGRQSEEAPLAAGHTARGRNAGLGGPAACNRRRLRGRRGLAVALAGLLVAGTAAAAVVSLDAEPSKPLAGPVKTSAPNARAYAISLLPEFRAGNAGWCSSLRFSTGGRTTSSGMGCGPARAAGGNMIAGGGVQFSRDNVQYVIATARVRAVRFGDDGPVVATETDPALPYDWRYAVAVVRRPRVDVAPPLPGKRSPKSSAGLSKALQRAVLRSQPVLLDEAGHTLPSVTRADRLSRGARSRRVTRAAPARRCVIGRAAGFPLGYARVSLGKPHTAPRLEGRAFASCAYSVFHRPGGRGGITVMILLDAQHPARQAADLPSTPGLDGRRLGPGWIAAYGASAAERAALLARLHPRL
jgi:hypothetical protein